jgi:hypothetical protein
VPNDRRVTERRRDRRLPFRVRLILSRGGQAVAAWTEDVSFAGIFVRMDTLLPVRQLVRLKLTLPPENDELSAMGMVARHIPARGALPPGVGIQFYSLGTAERRRWTRFIQFAAASNEVTAPIPLDEETPVAEAVSLDDLFSDLDPPPPPPETPPPVARLPAPMPPTPEPEPIRRSYTRYPTALQVRLHSVEDLETLYTRNVSKGGLYFGTTLDLPEGTPLKLSVIHPRTADHFTFEATVRWRDTSAEPGLGLEFSEFSEARREAFFEFIRSEIPVEEVEYVTVGDPHLSHLTPPG